MKDTLLVPAQKVLVELRNDSLLGMRMSYELRRTIVGTRMSYELRRTIMGTRMGYKLCKTFCV